jgi:serine/threonine protein kinase
LNKYIHHKNKLADMEKRKAQENEWIVQIMRGINFLHSNFIVHGDIKPQ